MRRQKLRDGGAQALDYGNNDGTFIDESNTCTPLCSDRICASRASMSACVCVCDDDPKRLDDGDGRFLHESLGAESPVAERAHAAADVLDAGHAEDLSEIREGPFGPDPIHDVRSAMIGVDFQSIGTP